ncbi:hypothetical protein BH20CHL4_BH20CHL4_07910 [soil metagenome]
MAAAPAMIEKPLSISVEGSVGRPSGDSHGGTLHVGKVEPGAAIQNQQLVAIMASSLHSPPIPAHEELAIQGVLSIVAANGGEQHLSELMKQGFRAANRAVRADIEAGGITEVEGVAMLALLTRGKYATLGLVGPDRAYLMRANRLTQLTRDQRVVRARSRRKQDLAEQQAQPASASPVQLLGEQERLDSRSPAIFEITLLPEDRLGLLSRGILDLFPEERIDAAFGSSAYQGAGMLTEIQTQTSGAPMMAAMLQVGPSRDTQVYVPAGMEQARSWWPVLFLSLIAALSAIAAGVYFVAL